MMTFKHTWKGWRIKTCRYCRTHSSAARLAKLDAKRKHDRQVTLQRKFERTMKTGETNGTLY